MRKRATLLDSSRNSVAPTPITLPVSASVISGIPDSRPPLTSTTSRRGDAILNAVKVGRLDPTIVMVVTVPASLIRRSRMEFGGGSPRAGSVTKDAMPSVDAHKSDDDLIRISSRLPFHTYKESTYLRSVDGSRGPR